jgi:hypothetical protein
MATPQQPQSSQGSGYYGQAQAGPAAPGTSFPAERSQSAAQYAAGSAPQQFEHYVIIHIATTCDEHGVYVTKDSAEVIEIGWVVVNARDPNLPEVRCGRREACRVACLATWCGCAVPSAMRCQRDIVHWLTAHCSFTISLCS